MPKMSGNRYIAEFLKANGVTHFFYVPVLFPEAVRQMTRLGLNPIVAHAEKAAAYMADGYARVARRPGVCGAQHIGGSNLAAGMRDPLMAKSPVVAITGGATPDSRYRGLYQDVDDTPTFRTLTKWTGVVEKAERLPDLLAQAFRIACAGRPGPVHLELPGFWGAVAVGEIDVPEPGPTPGARLGAYRPLPSDEELDRALERLAAAERPIIVAGGGVVTSGAEAAFRAFCEAARLPFVTSLAAKGVAVDSHPLLVGVCGEYARDSANLAVTESDLVVFIGSNTGGQVTRNWTMPTPDKPVIQLDLDPSHIGRNYPDTLGLVGDARATLEALRARLNAGHDRSAWLARIAEIQGDWARFAEGLETSDAIPMRPERLSRELSEAMPENAILVVDTGHAGGWLARHIRLTQPGQQVIRAAGSLGWGIPAAMGAKAAAPDRPVICFTGDGGALYHLTELETAVRYQLPTVIVINDNSSLNQEMLLWGGVAEDEHNWKFKDIDYAKVAEGFGAWGRRVDRPEEVQGVIAEALATGRPAVIDARTTERGLLPPSWGPGRGEPYRTL